ncbi:tail fiber domain-containing protein [candidate division KSB1 bacterium]|nr:tail fiber domain-containing protein [candidate division KSB1 bacterium]
MYYLNRMLSFVLILTSCVWAQMIVKNSTNTELVRITEEGKMGIGTSDPAAWLTIKPTIRIGPDAAPNLDAPLSAPDHVQLLLNDDSNYEAAYLVAGKQRTTVPYGYLALATQNEIGGWSESVRLTSYGLGIGTTKPLSSLSVKGGAAIGSTYGDGMQVPASGLIVEGNVGFGITNPGSYKLYVAGSARVNSLNINGQYTFPTADGSAGYVLKTNGSGTVSWQQDNTGGSGGDDDWTMPTSPSDVMYANTARTKVGIGTNSPTAQLDLNGATSTLSSLRIRAGSTPTTLNTGDLWHASADNRLYFRAGTTTLDITGDIRGVTAGTGLSGGGSGGTVTLNVGDGAGISVGVDVVSVNVDNATIGINGSDQLYVMGLPSGDGDYIWNQTAANQTAGFRISGTGRANTSFQSPVYSRADAGTVAIRPNSNSTTAIQLQNAGGASIVNVDATNQRVGIGTDTPTSKFHVKDGAALIENGWLTLSYASFPAHINVSGDDPAENHTYSVLNLYDNNLDNEQIWYLGHKRRTGMSQQEHALHIGFHRYWDTDSRLGIAITTGAEESPAAPRVGIGTALPRGRLDVNGSIYANLASGTGTGVVISGGQLLIHNSSERFKENIEPLQSRFENILNAQPISFTYKQTKQRSIGYLAEEFDRLGLKDLVNYENGQPQSISYDKISIYLLEMIKTMKAEIEELRSR